MTTVEQWIRVKVGRFQIGFRFNGSEIDSARIYVEGNRGYDLGLGESDAEDLFEAISRLADLLKASGLA